MKREVFGDKEVERVVNVHFTPVMIDVDNPNSIELLRYFKVDATPTTIILDSQGKILDYAVGKVEKKKFLEMISSIESQ